MQDLSLSFLRGHLSILNIKENLLLYAEYDRVLRFPGAVEVLEAAHSSTRSGQLSFGFLRYSHMLFISGLNLLFASGLKGNVRSSLPFEIQ